MKNDTLKKDPSRSDMNIPTDSSLSRNRKKPLIFIITICICILTVAVVALVFACSTNNERDTDVTIYDSFPDIRYEWRNVAGESFAILKVNKRTSTVKRFSNIKNPDALNYVKFECDIIYHQYETLSEETDASSGYLYLPEDYSDSFAPGDVVLIDAAEIWVEDGLCFMPIVGRNNKPEYLRFVDGKLSFSDGWRTSKSFELLSLSNDFIDMAEKENVPVGEAKLPNAKLEAGASIEDTVTYLSTLKSAAKDYDLFYSKSHKNSRE